MSQIAAPSDSLSSPVTTPVQMPLTVPIVIGIVGIFLFLSTQIFIAAGAAVWAIGGYFHFGLTGFSVLIALAGVPIAYLCWKILVMAIRAERDPANN